LGLSIAQAFVQAHGGKIGVKRRQGESGSHFWFSVPLNAGFDSFDFSPS
jgi:signal transduction histidine kinase